MWTFSAVADKLTNLELNNISYRPFIIVLIILQHARKERQRIHFFYVPDQHGTRQLTLRRESGIVYMRI